MFDQKEIKDMETTIKSHKSLIKRIAIIRNQYIAHNQLTRKHLAEETTYKYEEGKRLLIDLNNILEKVSRKYDQNIYLTDSSGLLGVSPSLNVEDMLRNLKSYRNEQIKKRSHRNNLRGKTIKAEE
jgi:hypothetical protein